MNSEADTSRTDHAVYSIPELGPTLRDLRRAHDALLERLSASIDSNNASPPHLRVESPERRRVEIVQRLLCGGSADQADCAELDYDIHAWHLGIVAAGPRASSAVRRVATDIGCQLLSLPSDDGVIWAWLGARQALKVTAIEDVLSVNTVGASFALGSPSYGLHGWRQSHREAAGAQQRARLQPEQVVRYSDTPLLIAALKDDTIATWLRAFLAPLCNEGDRGILILSTLRAYLDAGCNSSSAAAALSVRRQTVGSRVRAAEALLERPLRTCLAELDIALQLIALPPDVSPSTHKMS
jgi:PucR C-terminal helix-turn-helix domain/GGDEF-like domain